MLFRNSKGNSGVPSLTEWLSKNLTRGEAVGVDPALYSKTEWDPLEKELKSNGITLSKVEDNLVDMIWDDRPSCSNNSVFELDTKFAGKDVSIKITEVRKEMQDSNVGILVVSELEEVACKIMPVIILQVPKGYPEPMKYVHVILK